MLKSRSRLLGRYVTVAWGGGREQDIYLGEIYSMLTGKRG